MLTLCCWTWKALGCGTAETTVPSAGGDGLWGLTHRGRGLIGCLRDRAELGVPYVTPEHSHREPQSVSGGNIMNL